MDWAKLLSAVFGEAAQVVPLFVHNPKSQKIEGVIMTTAAGLAPLIEALIAQAATPPAK